MILILKPVPPIPEFVYKFAKRARKQTKDADPLAAIVESVWAESWHTFQIAIHPEHCIRCGHQVIPLTMNCGIGRDREGNALCHPNGPGHEDCFTIVTRTS